MLISTGICDLSYRADRRHRHTLGRRDCLPASLVFLPTLGKINELNLLGIQTLRREFPNPRIGYSGNEVGVLTTVMASILAAVSVEHHIAFDRCTMWGSDQAALLEPSGAHPATAGHSRLGEGARRWHDQDI